MMYEIIGELKGRTEKMTAFSSQLSMALANAKTQLGQSQAAASAISSSIDTSLETQRTKQLLQVYKAAFDDFSSHAKLITKEIEQQGKAPRASANLQETAGALLNTARSIEEKAVTARGSLIALEDSLNNNSIRSLVRAMDKSNEELNSAAKTIEAIEPPDTLAATVSELVVRVGILILTVYLAQVLLGIYKYNIQLADHYLSRIEAILLSVDESTGEIDLKLLEGLCDVLSTSSLGFGNPEGNPAKELSEIARTLADLRKSAS